jgi:hypothetical protein
MNDMYNGFQSILGGPVIGLFTCALFLPTVNSHTALAALAVSLALNFYLVAAHYRWVPADPWSSLLHAYWISFWVNVAFFATTAAVELTKAVWRCLGRRKAAERYFKVDENAAVVMMMDEVGKEGEREGEVNVELVEVASGSADEL